MNLRSLNSSSMQGASFDREIASGFARKAISQDGEAVRSDSSAVAVDDAQVARTTSAPVVLRVGFKAGKMTAGKHGEDPEVSEAVRRLQKSRLGYRFTKRAFDIVFSAFVLVSFSWLFVIVAIAIKIDDPKGPVFFKQKRVGKDGKEFNMYKFRSMCVDAEDRLAELRELNEKSGPVFKIAADPRITRVGKWLRKLSLDEFPQFINVLRSDMSAVGPRPTADIHLPMLARHPHRCSGRLGVSERARPYSASIQPSSLSSSVSANWEISCGGGGSVSGRGAPLPIGAIRYLLD